MKFIFPESEEIKSRAWKGDKLPEKVLFNLKEIEAIYNEKYNINYFGIQFVCYKTKNKHKLN